MVSREKLGEYPGDGLRITNEAADISHVPDGTFISAAAFRERRVKWIGTGFTELDSAPDLVIEVVSDSSGDRDTEWLMGAYWEAGIRESWLIDARREPLRFDICKSGAKGFTGVRKSARWIESAVLGKSFRFRAVKNALGHPDFSLDCR